MPFDSSGIHIYDLITGSDVPIRADSSFTGRVYPASQVRWSPDGTHLAFIENRMDGQNISLINPDGTGYRILSSTQYTYDYLHWYSRPLLGRDGVLFVQTSGSDGGPYYAAVHVSMRRRFSGFGANLAPSPDGEWIAKPAVDPTNQTSILIVERIGDLTGLSRRQLTNWKPPSPPAAPPPSTPETQPPLTQRRHTHAILSASLDAPRSRFALFPPRRQFSYRSSLEHRAAVY
jgi:hypothetical protein